MPTDKQKEITTLVDDIKKSTKNNPASHDIQTSERVLKRITDGIYRQPSSALRELISNAYDADATKVVIETDRPRFKKITILDNGNGFTEEALASMICNIGGSPKRTLMGSNIGVASETDPDLSPGGRRLIGKIGIGIFAVAQLTKEFKIITKTKGSGHRTIAHVILNTNSEENLKKELNPIYRTGITRIWQQKAQDKKSHGTEVILLNPLPKTINDLSSRDRWIQSSPENYLFDDDDEPLSPPKYHIGCTVKGENRIFQKPNLPWKKDTSPKKKFEKLVTAIRNETGTSTPNPKLEDLLDNYLKLLWTLGLQVPVSYLDTHPFEVCGKDNISTYKLGNTPKSKASKVELKPNETVAKNMKLNTSGLQKDAKGFQVFIDGIQIFRPLLYKNSHITEHAIKRSLLFVGKDKPGLKHIPEEIRGGHLEFEAYLFWQPKVVPVEHIGVLVRINNSNGTLFDETFMKYPVSEQTRKKQITAEIFIKNGMDAALNIDRESFNYAHPHYQYLAKWLHNAFKQFATAHKKLGAKIRERKQLVEAVKKADNLEKFVASKIKQIKPDTDISPIKIEISNEPLINITEKRKKGKLIYESKKILPPSTQKRTTNKDTLGQIFLEEKMEAIAEVLMAYDLLDDMPYEKQESLLKDIAEIIAFES